MENIKRQDFSRIGFALLATAALTLASSLAINRFAGNIAASNPTLAWFLAFLPQYAVAMPVGYLIVRPLASNAPIKRTLNGNEYAMFLLMTFPVMYAGNLVGTLLSSLLTSGEAQNPLIDFAMEQSILKVLVAAVVAPVAEELFFRKLLIDRTKDSVGEGAAILFSSAMFSLMHMNLFQMVYAFGVGALFAYIYVRSGRIIYSISLHAIINFLGIAVAPWILSKSEFLYELTAKGDIVDPAAIASTLDAAALRDLLIVGLYGFLIAVVTAVGFAILMRMRRRFYVVGTPDDKRGTARAMLLNVGVIAFAAFCAVMTVITLFSI